MRRLCLAGLGAALLSCAPDRPFPGANLFVDGQSRYHLFLISPPWEAVSEGLPRLDVPPADDRADFAIFASSPFVEVDPIAVAALSIYPPAPLPGGLAGAVEARRAEISANEFFGEPGPTLPFVTSTGAEGFELSFAEAQIIFHREFFFAGPDGAISRLFYAAARPLDVPEVDEMTRTFTFGPPTLRD